MANYNRRYSFDEKYQSIENLINFYTNADSSDYKASRLPNWLDFYGQTLLTEKNIEYYNVFSQGTVVTVDYGVPVGGEMSGIHFAIVLSNNDTRRKKTILTIPLSSHNRPDRIYLGKDILHKAQLSMEKQLNQLQLEEESLNNQKSNLVNNLEKSNRELSRMKAIKQPSKERINSIKRNVKKYRKDLSLITKNTNTLSNKVNQFKKELERLGKYNNDSYACLSSISSVSKLKIKKFSKYGIHSNISIDEKNLNLIKTRIKKFIDID